MTNELTNKPKNTNDDSRKEAIKILLADIESAKTDMEIAQRNFDCVYIPDEVDIYIYKLRAAQTRYCKLIKQLKTLS